MLKRVAMILLSFFVALLSACTFGGEGFFPRVTYGVPTQWLVNREFIGKVFDLSSCAEINIENETIFFYQSMCKAVADAEITLSIGLHEDGSADFKYITKSDADGRFQFDRHTIIRLIDSRDNAYSAGALGIVAEGYHPFRESVIWSDGAGDYTLGLDDEYKLRDFAIGRIKNLLFVKITIPKENE